MCDKAILCFFGCLGQEDEVLRQMAGRKITKRSSPTEDPDAYLQEEDDMIFNRRMNQGALENHATGRFSFRDLGVSDDEYLRQAREQHAARMQLAAMVTPIPDDIRAPKRYARRQEYAPKLHHMIQRPQDFYTEWEATTDSVPLGARSAHGHHYATPFRRPAPQQQQQQQRHGRSVTKVVEYYIEEITDDDDEDDDEDEDDAGYSP